MAAQYIQIVNNLIQFDNTVYRLGADAENGVPVLILSKLSDSTVIGCKIYGSVVYYLVPLAQVTVAATPFGNGMKVTIT